MTGLWTNAGEGWKLLAPAGFPDEATLHSLVEEAPELLPLSGDPGIVIVGRESQCRTAPSICWPSTALDDHPAGSMFGLRVRFTQSGILYSG